MYPGRFKYEAPKSVEEAIALLTAGKGEAKIIAGGQSLVPMLKLRFASPEALIDINNIPGLNYHRVAEDGSFRIGALCRHEDIEKSKIIKNVQPTIASAAHLVADPIVRARGTFVGSVCHADPQGDWAATMMATNGYMVVQGPKGKREIAMTDFITGPFTNAMEYNEIAIEAVIPAAKGKNLGGYLKLERRVGDFATASVAVSLDMVDGIVHRAGIALCGVGGRTINAAEEAKSLEGKPLNESSIAKAAQLSAAAAEPRTDNRGSSDYKRHIVSTFVSRILNKLNEGKVAA